MGKAFILFTLALLVIVPLAVAKSAFEYEYRVKDDGEIRERISLSGDEATILPGVKPPVDEETIIPSITGRVVDEDSDVIWRKGALSPEIVTGEGTTITKATRIPEASSILDPKDAALRVPFNYDEYTALIPSQKEDALHFPTIAYYGYGDAFKFIVFEQRSVVEDDTTAITRSFSGRLVITDSQLPEQEFTLDGEELRSLVLFVTGEQVGTASFDFENNKLSITAYNQEFSFTIFEAARAPVREREGVDPELVIEKSGDIPTAQEREQFEKTLQDAVAAVDEKTEPAVRKAGESASEITDISQTEIQPGFLSWIRSKLIGFWG